jgi:hypothetical protein
MSERESSVNTSINVVVLAALVVKDRFIWNTSLFDIELKKIISHDSNETKLVNKTVRNRVLNSLMWSKFEIMIMIIK